MSWAVTTFLRGAMFVICCGVLAGSVAYAQNDPCSVSRLRLRIATGDDDLRGGQDNLNIIVYFTSRKAQLALNVNRSYNWPNKSVNLVNILLSPPVPPNEIHWLRFIHVTDGSVHWEDLVLAPAWPITMAHAFQSPDNWDMANMAVRAVGNGVSAQIAKYGFHRFTGANPDLTIPVQIPPNVCGLDRTTELRPPIKQTGSGSNGDSRILQPLAPRTGSNSNSGNSGTVTLTPLSPRGLNPGSGNSGTATLTQLAPHGSNPGSGGGPMTGTLHKLNPPARMVMRPIPPALKAKIGPPKKGQPIQNPAALQANAALITLLRAQRQSANAEAARMMKLEIAPKAQTGMLGQQSQLMSVNGSPATMPVVHPQAAVAKGTKSGSAVQPPANRTLLAAPAGVQAASRPGSVGSVGPSQTLNASGNAVGPSTALQRGSNLTQPIVQNANSGSGNRISARMVTLSPGATVALRCVADPSMRVLNVNGSTSPATFTPDIEYNFYTITGCSFGNMEPNAKVYIYKGATFHEEFQIQEWHDNWIKLNLDPNLSGLLDQDNLTLVVQRADGQQTSQAGFKFYAAREKTHLNQIPSNDFGLYGLNIVDTSRWSQYYNSPVPTADGWGFGGMTARVGITEGLAFLKNGDFETPQNTPSPGADIYDLSQLQPGFVPTDADLSFSDMNCSDMGGTLITSGDPVSDEFNGSQLWVHWPGENCKNVSCGTGFFQTDCFEIPFIYGVDVWVEGPRGVDPWTGLPTR